MFQKLLRRKRVEHTPMDTELSRSLTLFDLTVMGMGSTIGTGVYTLLGVIVHDNTGPAIIVSFLLSGFASILSALCYSEFAGRVPRAGSAYLYSFVTMGEGVAWFTGWQLLLEYIIGASSVGKGLTNYIDALANKKISSYMKENVPWNLGKEFSKYPDFLSFGFIMFVTALIVAGVKESASLNNLLTSINASVILFTVIFGAVYVNMDYVTDDFAPYGINGIFQGASISFFCYVGFDVIATAAEEAKNPKRDLPLAIIGSLVACALCYVSASFIISAMQPYKEIDESAPLAQAFAAHNVTWAKTVISIGAICGCFSSLLMGSIPMPRITYAISSDGLLPTVFARVHHRFKTPHIAAWSTGFLAAVLALIFPYETLANMMSLGTLMAYTAVCMSALVLRHREYDELQEKGGHADTPDTDVFTIYPRVHPETGAVYLFGKRYSSCYLACVYISIFFVAMCTVSMSLMEISTVSLSFASVGLLVMLYCMLTMVALPSKLPELETFVVPFCPYLPMLAILCNAHLLVHLPWMTWVRFVVWCGIGVALYVFYGAEHSKAGEEGLLDEHKDRA